MRNLRKISIITLPLIFISFFFVRCGTYQECREVKPISCAFNKNKFSKDSAYTILILAFNEEFNIYDIKVFSGDKIVRNKEVRGDNDNPQFDPLRLELIFNKDSIHTLNIFYNGFCYQLPLLKDFDNYLIEYNLKDSSFTAIANNEEYLIFE